MLFFLSVSALDCLNGFLFFFLLWLANWPNDRPSEWLLFVCHSYLVLLLLDFNVRYMVAG